MNWYDRALNIISRHFIKYGPLFVYLRTIHSPMTYVVPIAAIQILEKLDVVLWI